MEETRKCKGMKISGTWVLPLIEALAVGIPFENRRQREDRRFC